MFLNRILSHKVAIALFLIILLGTFLRFYKLTEIPPGLTLDEVSIGYNGFTILTTGRDQDGNFLPLGHFRSVGDYKLPFEIYVVSFFLKIFGNTALGIRFPSAFFGTLTIPVVFFLAKNLFDKKVAILSAFFIAISPWHVFHSHLGLENNIGLFFSSLSILFLWKSLKRPYFFIISILFSIFSFYSHHAFWLFLPFIFAIFIFLNRKYFLNLNKKIFFLSIVILIISLTPFLAERQALHVRSKQISFSSQIFNKYVKSYSLITWYNASGFDNVDVLPNHGLFYFFEFPLLISGIITLLKKKDKKSIFLISWLLIYPIPLAVSNNFSAARMYQLLPLPQIVEAVGFMALFSKNIYFTLGFLAIILYSFFRLLPTLWFVYPYTYSRFVDYGPVAIVEYTKQNRDKNFYIEEPLFHKLYLLYFYKVLPKDIKPWVKNEKGSLITSYKNIYLVERGYIPGSDKNNLMISFLEDIPKSYKKIGSINLKSGEPYAYISSPD